MFLSKNHNVLLFVAITCFSTQAKAIPPLIPVQGYLTDDQGVPLDGQSSLTLRLYEDDTSQTPLHEETQDTTLSQGYFTVFLGSEEPIDLSLFRLNPALRVGIAVNSSPGTGVEFVPRIVLGTSPYAAFCFEAAYEPTSSGLIATDVQAALDELAFMLETFIDSKGAANGLATLDANARVPAGQLGSGAASGDTYLRGDGAWAALPVALPPKAVVTFALTSGDLTTHFASGVGSGPYAGWAICNGNNGTPNLSNRFVRLVTGAAGGDGRQ